MTTTKWTRNAWILWIASSSLLLLLLLLSVCLCVCVLCVLSLNKLFALCVKFVCEMKNIVFLSIKKTLQTDQKRTLRGGFQQKVPKKIWSHIKRLKHTHDNPIPLFTSPNVALSRRGKKSLDPTRNSQVQFSSSKWRLGLKILSSIIITDILAMSSPVFVRRMVQLVLFRAQECKIAISRINAQIRSHSTFKFDWNRTWMFQLLEFCDMISYCDLSICSEFRTIKICTKKDMREEHAILA